MSSKISDAIPRRKPLPATPNTSCTRSCIPSDKSPITDRAHCAPRIYPLSHLHGQGKRFKITTLTHRAPAIHPRRELLNFMQKKINQDFAHQIANVTLHLHVAPHRRELLKFMQRKSIKIFHIKLQMLASISMSPHTADGLRVFAVPPRNAAAPASAPATRQSSHVISISRFQLLY